MVNIDILLRLTRVKHYITFLLFIFFLIYLISPENLLSYRAVLIFLANLCLTSGGYALNDVEDAEDDRNHPMKRIRNPITSGDLTKRRGYIITASLLIMGLFLLYLASLSAFVVGVGLMLTVVLLFYSLKPFRFKSVPFLDIISHTVGLGVTQFSTTYLTFRPLDLEFIPFLMILIPASASVEIIQEVRDFEVDKRAGINNTVQKLKIINPLKLLIVMSGIISLGFILLCYTRYLSVDMVYLSPLVFLLAMTSYKRDLETLKVETI